MRRRPNGFLGLLVVGLVAILVNQSEAQTPSRLSFDPNGRFLIHGQPAFVRGVYDSGGSAYLDPGEWESAVFLPGGDIWGTRGLAGTAINMYLNYWQGQDIYSQLGAALTTMQKYSVMWLQTTNCFQDGSYTRIPFSVDQPPAGQLAGQLAQNSQTAGYYVMDECSDSSYGGADLVPETQSHYAALKSYDPQAIVMAVPIALGYRDPKLWTQPASGGPTADLFATDPYPLYNAEPSTGYPHFAVADYIARLRDGVPASQPVAAVLQFFKFTSNSRLPTYAEMRMHAYSAIVEGAQGLFWWDIGVNGLRNSNVQTADQVTQWMGYLQTLVNELAALEPALVAPETPGALVGNSSSTGDPVGWRKTVLQRDMTIEQPLSYSTYQWYQAELDALNAGDTSLSPMLRRASPQSGNIRTRTSIVNGVGYVIAYNYTNLPATVTLTWQNPVTQVSVIGESRTLAPSGASFTDSFAAYDVHVYQITSAASDPPPSPLAVSITNPANGATVSGSTTVSLVATGGTPPYSSQIAVDGTTIYTGANATTSWATTNATNGSHTVTATVTDSSSPAVTASASIQVTVANLAPLTASLTSPAAGATASGTTTITMADSGASGSSAFTLAIDGTTVSTQTVTGGSASYSWNTTTASNGSHTLSLNVTDGAGRTATTSESVTVSNVAPLAGSFTSPAAGASVSGTTTVGASSTGGASGARTFTLSFAGPTTVAPLSQTIAGTTASFSWDTTKVANGSYTLTLTVTDAAGTSATATRGVTVSNSIAAATFTAAIPYPASGATVGGGQTVGMSTTATWGRSKTFTLSVDNTVITSQVLTGTTLWIQWNTATISDGSHTLTLAVAYNGATAKASIPVTVKNGTGTTTSPLTASLTSPASGATVNGTTTIGMAESGASGSSTFALALDGTTVSTQTTTGATAAYAWDTTKATNGSHTVSLTVTDGAGRTATASESVTVANVTPLSGSFASPAPGAGIGGTTSIGMSSSGGASGSRTFTLSFSGPTTIAPVSQTVTGAAASYSWDTTKVANGSYTLTMTVTDAAGATATATLAVTVSNTTTSTPSFRASISYPANGATVGGNQTVGMATTATWGTAKTFTLSVDGKTIMTETFTGSTDWYSWNTTGLANGTHTLALAVTNSTGTVTSSIVVNVKN